MSPVCLMTEFVLSCNRLNPIERTNMAILLVQVLCCEVDGILTALLQDECTMDLLFSLLQQVRLTRHGLQGTFVDG